MKIVYLFTCITALLFFNACTSDKTKLAKVWFYISEEDARNEDEGSKGSLPYDMNSLSFVNLQTDGTYTAYLSQFEEGQWMLKEGDQIILENQRKQITILPIKEINKEELVLLSNKMAYHFEGYENNFATAQDNPFSRQNNLWRIKAAHKESDAEITNRLKNHFKFWEQYFSWGIKIDKKMLNVRSLPSPLKLYSNGFELIPYEEQPEKWTANFYDTSDSRRAYEKLHTFLTTEDIDWPTTDHKFKLFTSAFKQLQQRIK